jgi:hypothetical protein
VIEEAIEALQSVLTSALVGQYGFNAANQIDRRFKLWNQVDIQPALFIVQKTMQARTTDRQPTRLEVFLDLVLYVKGTADQMLSISLVYNPIMDAIFAALAGKPSGELQTLNGTAYQCKIDGKIDTDEGTLGDQGVVMIPVTLILLP